MTPEDMTTLLQRLSAFSSDMAKIGMRVTTEVRFPDPDENRFKVVNVNIVVRPETDTDDEEAA